MKLSFLLVVPSLLVAPVTAERSKAEWVGDLKAVTSDYRKILTGVKNTSHGPWIHFYATMQPLDESRKHLDSAVNWQRIALTPHPSRGNIAEGVSGGSCVAIADYFPEISSVGIEAMDALLDPTFVCDKNVKDTLRPKTSRWRGTWQQMNYAWDQYDTLYYENCKDEPGAKQVLQQSYLPLKKKFQEATDAYQDVDAYCAQKA